MTEVSSLAESTVLRKNIVAHLQSQCVSHVLSRKRAGSPIDGLSKEVVEVREGLRGMGLALRSYTHKFVSVVISTSY